MAERWRALKTVTYPVDEATVKAARAAGGLSQLTPEQKARLKMKVVAPGKWCDDVPPTSQAWLVTDGAIERVTVEDDASKPKRKV